MQQACVLYGVERIRQTARKEKISDSSALMGIMAEEVRKMLTYPDSDLELGDTPAVIMVVGVNGAGKTTSIAKLAYRFKNEEKRVLLAAADTFRAAAIDQLQIWADRVGVELIKHQEGADPGAVVFDALNAARARKADVLIIDTAGRLQNKTNLMKEISKIKKIVERESALTTMDEITSGKFSAMADKVTDALGRVKDAISSAIDRIKEWNNTTVREKVFSIKERITRIISTITGGGAASNFSGTSFFPGGLTMVGELGPELVALPRGSRIYNDYETKELLGKRHEIIQHITINSPTPLTPAETARRIKNASRQLALEW
jgi:adenylate kinase family enzyme